MKEPPAKQIARERQDYQWPVSGEDNSKRHLPPKNNDEPRAKASTHLPQKCSPTPYAIWPDCVVQMRCPEALNNGNFKIQNADRCRNTFPYGYSKRNKNSIQNGQTELRSGASFPDKQQKPLTSETGKTQQCLNQRCCHLANAGKTTRRQL